MLQDQRLSERARRLLGEADRLALPANRQDIVTNSARTLDYLVGFGIVGPDHGGSIRRQKLLEQPHLGFEIGLHRIVIVEMIAAEIGEGCSGQRHAFGARLIETVTRSFISHVADAHSIEARHVR